MFTIKLRYIIENLDGSASISIFDKILAYPGNSQQNLLEPRLNQQASPFFQRNACVSERGHLNFKQLPTTQDIKQICEFRDTLKIQTLENKHRTILAKALISFILKNNQNKKLIPEDFLQLAQSIVEIFPSELKETYYVPFEKGHLAKGKLHDAYFNTRRRLREAGIIDRRVKPSSPTHSTDNSVPLLQASESSCDLDEISNSCNSQQHSLELPESHANTCVIKEEYPGIKEEFARFEEELSSIKEECPSFTPDNNLLIPQNYFQHLPSIEAIKQIAEFRCALNVQVLENKHRTSIAKALISFILNDNPDTKLTREDFLHLTQCILKIFPSEIQETYYVPFQKGHLAKGKLFIAYNNIKARFRAAGIIQRGVTTTSENHSADNSASMLSASESSSDQEEISGTSNTQQNFIDISMSMLEEQAASFIQENAYFSETENPNFSVVNNFCAPSKYFQPLPTTQELRQINVIQHLLKVQVLENKHRTSIAKAIILFILKNDPDKKLTRDDFLQLVESVVEIFPFEVKETYYVPFTKGRLAKGKLYDAYNNTKSRLSAAGVIRRRVKSKAENPIPFVTHENTPNIFESSNDFDESEIEVLKTDCSEWDLVLRTWRKTHHFRQHELQTENLSIADYFKKYKVLFNDKNYELFDIDFKILYPTSKSIYEWKLYFRKIIQKAKALHGDKVKELLNHIQNADNEDSKLALSLTLVSYLLPNCRQRKKSEIQESFICYCEDIADNEIQHQIKRLKIESQPKVFLIGNSNKTISLAYVDICGIRLKFTNPMKAIEVCFQSFMVMNIKYPKYCSHVWIFVQKLIFQINTPRDIVIPAINTLINDLHSEIQK